MSGFSVCEWSFCHEHAFGTDIFSCHILKFINISLTINGFCIWFKKFFLTPKAMKTFLYITLWIFRLSLLTYSRLIRLNWFPLTVRWGSHFLLLPADTRPAQCYLLQVCLFPCWSEPPPMHTSNVHRKGLSTAPPFCSMDGSIYQAQCQYHSALMVIAL